MTVRIVAGALLALVAVLVLRWMMPDGAQDPAPPELDTRFDYVLRDFSALFSDSQGEPSLEISGPRLEHDPDTRHALIDQPRFEFGPGHARWFGTADKARIDRERDQLALEDNVLLHSMPLDGPPSEVTGQRMLLDNRARTITSDDPVTMRQPGTELRANGLKVSLDPQTIRMKDHVEGHFSLDARAAAGDIAPPAGDRQR